MSDSYIMLIYWSFRLVLPLLPARFGGAIDIVRSTLVRVFCWWKTLVRPCFFWLLCRKMIRDTCIWIGFGWSYGRVALLDFGSCICSLIYVDALTAKRAFVPIVIVCSEGTDWHILLWKTLVRMFLFCYYCGNFLMISETGIWVGVGWSYGW